MKAAIYARFSSDKQDADSIEAQVRACQDYATKNGHIVLKIYTDEAISGKGEKTSSRKQYQQLMRDCEKKAYEVILVHKYDRIARNVGEHVNLDIRLSDAGVSLVAVAQDFGTSKEAKIMKTMMWALSEYYIDNLSDEVKKGHREVALKAMHNGGYPPFGYDVKDGEYVVNEYEANYVKKIFKCAFERRGFSELIDEMDMAGMRGKRGKAIKYPQIYEILKNEKYTGVYTYSVTEEKDRALRRIKPNAIKIENALPVLIDKAIFKEVQLIMKGRQHTGKPNDFLCRGLVYCGECGAKMYTTKTKRKGHEYEIYYCSKKCGIGVINSYFIDDAVKAYIKNLLSDKNQELIYQSLKAYSQGERSRVAEQNNAIRRQLDDKQAMVENYTNTLGSGILPYEVIADISNKIVALKNEMKSLSELPIPHDYTVPQIINWLDALKACADERSTIELLVSRIEAKKTAVSVYSTLTAVVGCHGCGGGI
ncbi:MAG: recombinase family protein [Eubacteriales bacterium]